MQLGGYFHFYSGIDREGKKRFLNFDAFSRKKKFACTIAREKCCFSINEYRISSSFLKKIDQKVTCLLN